MKSEIWPGQPHPLGATYDGKGVNFAVYSEGATGVELCLFDEVRAKPSRVLMLREVAGFVWHGYVPGLKPGQLYGFRIHGPFNPAAGDRFNGAKLLIDPYAKAIAGAMDWTDPIFSYPLDHPEQDLAVDTSDNSAGIPKCVVIHQEDFDWEGDTQLRIPWNDLIIYEVHVRGFTRLHPEIPEARRGTYSGLVSEPALRYLQDLGVNAVELLPIHDFLREKHLVERGLTNYWGYNTRNFFSPSAHYCSSGDRGQQVGEFKYLVKKLHQAGIEVILDVVYNHTCEGNHLGPTISFRGIDNKTYYHLVKDDPRHYMDYSGTGNSLNANHPQVLKLIMDSLRYWVTEMHVDGFRFDLASALARELYEVDKLAAFFDIIHQDPILSRVKLIAEPWDVGDGGYHVGNFPILWSEWNGKFRDSVRKYWKGDEIQIQQLSSRLLGSSDLYQDDGREPYNSINLVTAHDGFTLADLVSYNEKHNQANGENNNDGSACNDSWNCGAEGPTGDPEIIALRQRQTRNFLATLLLSQGVPMICGGDEFGRTQNGNNNAYCQDNEISWFNWNFTPAQKELLEFTRELIRLRKSHPNFRRPKFLRRRLHPEQAARDTLWYSPSGAEMTEEDWHDPAAKCLGLLLDGGKLEWMDGQGEFITDDTFLLLLNARQEPASFVLPPGNWTVKISTSSQIPRIENGKLALEARSMLALKI